MCIQQPQDSSQRSAVIAHYNQSSWAHLGSPFRILHWEKHKTKPQSSTDPSPAVYPTQTSAAGAKGEDKALWQGLSAEDSKAQGHGRGQVKALPAPVGPSELPRVKAWTEAAPQCTQELGWAADQEPSPLTGLPATILGALPRISRQEQSQSREQQWAKKEIGALRQRSGLRLRRWKKNAKLVC